MYKASKILNKLLFIEVKKNNLYISKMKGSATIHPACILGSTRDLLFILKIHSDNISLVKLDYNWVGKAWVCVQVGDDPKSNGGL